MSEWLALPDVAARSGLSGRPIALRAGRLVLREAFLADVHAWQAAFAAQAGPRVALYFEDGYHFAAALYGAWHAGKLVYLPGDAQPDTLRRLLPQVDAYAGDLPGAMTAAGSLGAAGTLAPLDLRQTGLVIYTSGSSGEPVAIHKCLAQLDAEVHALQADLGSRFDADGSARIHATVTHQHIYGLLFCTLWPLAAGRAFASERLVYPEQMAARLAEHACVLVSSPAHLKRLGEMSGWIAARRRLRAVFSSGGPLPAEASQACLDLLGQSPVEVFGSSETGGIAWRQRAAHGERWTLLSQVDWRVDGELLAVRSGHLPDDQWLTTTDRVRALAPADGGGFVLLGRVDRIVKVEEKRVSLSALEAALSRCVEVAEARVIVLGGDATPRLAVVARLTDLGREVLQHEGKRALNERLRSALLQGFERVVLPRSWRYVPTIPVNAQGKSTEALLAALFRPVVPVAQWVVREADTAQTWLDIAPDLLVFDGHFPDRPMVPGVAQIDWVMRLARECFVLPAGFERLDALKFQRPVLPGMRLRLDLQWTAAAGVLGFRFSSEAGAHASGRVVFGE